MDKMIKDCSDEPDETIVERLIGLTEMFPETCRTKTYCFGCKLVNGVRNVYNFTQNTAWYFFSTAAIMALPVIMELEKLQVEEMSKTRQKQILAPVDSPPMM